MPVGDGVQQRLALEVVKPSRDHDQPALAGMREDLPRRRGLLEAGSLRQRHGKLVDHGRPAVRVASRHEHRPLAARALAR